MEKTLLQKAKAIQNVSRTYKKVDKKQMQEVALAWCRGEVNLSQICKSLGLDNTGYRVYSKLALALKDYLNENYKL